MKAVWANPEKSVGNLINEEINYIVVVEPGHPLWETFLQFGEAIQEYVLPEVPEEPVVTE
jgi:hypothetical protein